MTTLRTKKHIKNKLSYAILTATVTAGFPNLILANDGADKFQLDEIIVTASRREQSLQDVPMSMTTVNPEGFLASGLTSIENIIDYTPGITFNTGGTAASGSIAVRGVVQAGPIPVTAVYIDDVPVTSSTPFASGSSIFLDGLLGDLERVEIIKGPQGTLYGASSMGGIVRYISKDPALEETRGKVSVDISEVSEGGMTQLYRAMISTPIIEDKLGLTVSGFHNDKEGFIDRLDPATLALAEEDYNTAETYGLSATALFQISDDTSLKLSTIQQTTKTSGSDNVYFNVASADNITLSPQNGKYEIAEAGGDSRKVKYKKTDITFKHSLDWAEFVSVTGHTKYSRVENEDDIIGSEGFADFITGSPAGTSQSMPFYGLAESDKFIQEFRLSSSNNDTLEWQTGFFYAKDETDNVQSWIVEPQGAVLLDVTFPSDYEEKAVFANATYYLTPEFDITAGLRYSKMSMDAKFNFAGLIIDNIASDPSVSDNVTTYLLNARWRVVDNVSLYARVASGYRPAWANVPIEDAITGQVSSSVVDSDSLWSYELGAKGSLLDERFTYDVAVWAIDWDDFQTMISLNGVTTGGNSEVASSSQGFEGSFSALLTDQLRLQTTIAYTDSSIDGDTAELGAVSGEKTPLLPEWTASFQAIYDFSIGHDILATFEVGARYIDKYTTDYLGDASRGIGFGLTRQFPIEEVVLADMNTSFTKDNFTLTIYATNLFNNYTYGGGVVTMDGLDDISAQANIVTPRTIGASMSFSF